MEYLPSFIPDELPYCGDYAADAAPLPNFVRHDHGLYQGRFICEPDAQEGGTFSVYYQ